MSLRGGPSTRWCSQLVQRVPRYFAVSFLLPPPSRICNCVVYSSVCLLATLRKNFQTNLHEIFRECWQWTSEEMVEFWWWSGSQSGYRDCFPDSSLLGDMESGINWLRCTLPQCTACTSRHRRNNYDVITSAAHDRQQDWYRDTSKTCHGGGMPCPGAYSLILISFCHRHCEKGSRVMVWSCSESSRWCHLQMASHWRKLAFILPVLVSFYVRMNHLHKLFLVFQGQIKVFWAICIAVFGTLQNRHKFMVATDPIVLLCALK